jgi:hypothetical protein
VRVSEKIQRTAGQMHDLWIVAATMASVRICNRSNVLTVPSKARSAKVIWVEFGSAARIWARSDENVSARMATSATASMCI